MQRSWLQRAPKHNPAFTPPTPPRGCPGLSHGFKDGPKVTEEAELGSELSSPVTQCLRCARP